MKRMLVFGGVVVATALDLGAMSAPVEADSVSIGVNIGSPPPVIVSAAPPPLVAVPGSPVYYAPSLSVNYFAYGGRYYSHHNGAWFLAMTYNGPHGATSPWSGSPSLSSPCRWPTTRSRLVT